MELETIIYFIKKNESWVKLISLHMTAHFKYFLAGTGTSMKTNG